MRRFGAVLIAALMIISGVQTARAAEEFSLDKDRTTIGFNVSYLLLARVSGRFDDFKGSFIIDREHPEKSRADIIIQTASVNTGFKTWDADIRGPGLFNVALHPTMVFHSDKIELRADNTGQITGDLTLLGITKPVALDLVKGAGADKGFANGFKVTGEIKRSDFGMNAFIQPIGNVVTLLVCYNIADCREDDPYKNKGPARYNQ